MSESIPSVEYSTALVAAIGELQNVAKTAANPYFKSKYAPLDAIIDASVDQTHPDDLILRRLKKRRLAIRDELVRLESELEPPDHA